MDELESESKEGILTPPTVQVGPGTPAAVSVQTSKADILFFKSVTLFISFIFIKIVIAYVHSSNLFKI